MGYISDNGYAETGKGSAVLSNREHIEQGLGGMFMSTVSGVDNRSGNERSYSQADAGRAVANNRNVRR